MTRLRVLLLAGTAEASALARLLAGDPQFEVTASLAGRTQAPAAFPCPTRVGGFGGVEGLVRTLRSDGYDMLVDATHPFAARMPGHADAAAVLAGIPRVRLLRPPWHPSAKEDWYEAASLEAAAAALSSMGARRVLLTVGRQDLAPFAAVDEVHFLVRSIDEPDLRAFTSAAAVVARPPFAVAAEVDLLRSNRIDTLVTKNSGGDAAKLTAAAQEGVKVVMVRRPRPPAGPTVPSATAAHEWMRTISATV